MTSWIYWRMKIQGAYKRTMASLCEAVYKKIYGVCGLLVLAMGISLLLWVQLPSAPFLPQNHNEASITCREGENLCKHLEYTVNLFPDPNSENMLVTFETSRLPSATTSYNLNWPGRVTLSKIAVAPGSLIMDSIKEHGDCTQFTFQGRNEEPPPPGLETQQPVDHDRFSFVWVNGKEAMSFTDRRLRLKLRTEIPLFDQTRNPTLSSPRQGKVSMKASLTGLQQLSFEAPRAANPEGRPDVKSGAITRDYPEADELIVVFTEINRRNLATWIQIFAGVLIGVATNLLTQHFVQVAEERRPQPS